MGLRTDGEASMPVHRALVAAIVLGIAGVSVILPAGAAVAGTRPVTNCNGSGVGSLSQAVRNAPSGDTITFALPPTCSVITLSGTIDIAHHLAIDGPGATALAVSGNDTADVFHVDAGAVATISGLTIENGDAPDGGGIDNDGTLTLADSTVSDNSAATGGGGIWSNGTLTVTGSSVSGNSAGYYGGGIYSGSRGTLTVAHSTLAGNSASAHGIDFPEYAYGGALSAYGTATVTDSTLSDNTVVAIGGGGGGGGIDVGGTLNLDDSTVSGNRSTIVDGVVAGDGGGGILNGGSLYVSDSTVSDNSTDVDGGGIDNGWKLTVSDSTVSGDGATTGGGIDNVDGGTVSVAATLVADSASGNDCSGSITDDGYNLDDDGSCGWAATTDHSDTPAGLDPGGLRDNGGPTQTIALVSGSAAVDAVDNAAMCSAPDERGANRPTPCDIGAVELALTRQTIVFTSTPPPGAAVAGPNYTVSATGGASGIPVVFSVEASASSVCSVSGSTVSFIGVGTCILDANQAGSAGYAAAAQVQQSFGVAPQPQGITSSDAATATVGSLFSFTVTTTGTPVPSIASKGTLPKHLVLADNGDGTATIAGVPAKAGVYHFTIKVTFGKGASKDVVSQRFTLTIEAPT
jgi:hypothetical protein